MNFDLTGDQIMLRDTVRRFVQDKLVPQARAWDREEKFPHEVVAELGRMGLLGIGVEPEYGGSGLGSLETALVVEELARGDGSLALTVASHNGLCTGHIRATGTAEQKRKYLPPMACGDKLGAWALTEPGSGSDAAGMLTTATCKDGIWTLNGSKIFITQGTVGETFVVLANTDKQAGTRGITAFILEKGMEGFGQRPIKEKLGMRSSDTAILTFDNVQVSDAQRLGAVGRGFIDTLQVLDRGRITIAALALGLGVGAMAAARRYALDRKQFGSAICEFQAIQWKFANMAVELDAARWLVWRAAFLCDKKRGNFTKEAAMAKLFASEAAMRATEEAVQIHGGYGYTAEFPVERHFRDAKLCTIGEGTSEVQRLVISRAILH
jgi:alkylation response protein AidB-like acyl-CoA dehydrogenase